jgi:hypothetical protein
MKIESSFGVKKEKLSAKNPATNFEAENKME